MRMPASDRGASPGVQPAADREQASTESPPHRRISATDNCAMRPATAPEPRSPAPPAVVAEGRLYRRGKVTKWNRNWAVLTGDRLLKFYKSENVLSTSGPALQLDLSGGCDVQSIFQGKSCASFTLLLRPNSALHNLRSSEKSPSSPSRARKSTTTTEVRSVQLMCKSTHELVQWMKALVQVHDGRPPLRSLIPIRPQVSSSDSSPEPGVGGNVGAGLESRYDDIEFIDSDSTSDDDDDAIGAKFRARCANDAPLLPSKPKIAQNSNARAVDSPPAAAATTVRAPRARRSSGTRQLSPRALTRDDARLKTDATRAVGFIPTTNGARARRQQQQATASAIERNGRDAISSPTTTTSPPRENLPDSRRRIRRLSDGDLLEPIGDLGYRMRDLKQHVIPELTHVDFIEIYGYAIQPAIPSKESNSVEKTERIKLKFFDNVSRTNNRNSSYSDKKKPHTQKLIGRNEQKESPLGRKTRSSTLPGYGKQPARSSSEKKARNDSSSSWFSGVAESFRWKAKPASPRGRSTDRRSDRQSERAVDEARGPQHSGHLELRAKNKRHWNRLWCELRDERLYCYETRQAAAVREVLLLRGYTALAVPDATHKRAIRLERKGFPTYQLAAETVDERTSWMRALRHHLAPQRGEDGRAATAVERAESTKRDDTSDMSESAKRDDSGDTPDESDSRLADVEKQKQKLLRQLVTEQQKIREELQDLDRKHPSPTCSRDGHVTQASHDEQLIAKRLAHLSRRRNSAQLKCDHLARDMAPPPARTGAGKSRKRLSAPAGGGQPAPRLQEKMCETRQRLARIDAEIERLRMRKKELAASCREREALESQVTDRVSALRSLRDRSRDDLQRSYDSAPDFRTIAIDVASLEERSCSSSSSSSSPHSARSSEPDGALPRRHNSSDLDAVFSDSVWSVTGSDVTSMTSDDPLAASSPAVMTSASRRRSMMTSSQTSEWSARVAEVDPNVIASIEMFEEFSRKTLARLESNTKPGRKSK